MAQPAILTTTAEVAGLAQALRGQAVLAVDLEADSQHRYREQVCLVQLTAGTTTVLIDPLQGASLAPLAELFADPAVCKIFHAADYDLRCLYRDFGLEIRGLFDTMVSAQLLGEGKIGLADVLGKYFGVTLDKRFQRADWAIRPLPAEMIHYAAEDTRHLPQLMALWQGRLAELGRLEWAREEFALLETVRFAEPEGPLCLRLKGGGALSRRQLGVAEELLQWREGEAERRDRPTYQVLGAQQIVALAQGSPQSPAELEAVAGITARLTERYGKALLAAIGRGLARPDSELPRWPYEPRPERDPAVDARLAALKLWRRERAAALQLEPGVLINNALLETLARRPPTASAQLDAVPGLKSWQRHEFGDELLAVLAG